MRKKQIIVLGIFVALISIVFIVFMVFDIKKNTLFDFHDVNEYKYGVIYSYHSQDAVVQLYNSDGNIINKTNIPGVRACGLCSSTSKPLVKQENDYYFVSDAAFDDTQTNNVIKINSYDLTYEKIPLNMEINYTYNFSIDSDIVYAYYSGAPEWGCVYKTHLHQTESDYFAFYDLEGYREEIGDSSHFWPLDMVGFDDTNYYIGYIVNKYDRMFCIARIEQNKFEIEIIFGEYLFARCGNLIGENLFISVYTEDDQTLIYKYNLIEKETAILELPYYSNNVEVCETSRGIAVLNCDSGLTSEMRQVLYISDDLEILEMYEVVPNFRIYDFQSDEIVCCDGEFIFVYDYAWNEKISFKLHKEEGMKFSGIFVKQ